LYIIVPSSHSRSLSVYHTNQPTEFKFLAMAEKTIPTTTEAEYAHAFEGIENFRDVGATINKFLGKR